MEYLTIIRMLAEDGESPEVEELRAQIRMLQERMEALTAGTLPDRLDADNNRFWLSARETAVRLGSISLNTLGRRRRNGSIPKTAYRQVNGRVYVYDRTWVMAHGA